MLLEIINHFLSLGFTSVSVDLDGLVSGKLNRHSQVAKEDIPVSLNNPTYK